jgi:hypothetical protein
LEADLARHKGITVDEFRKQRLREEGDQGLEDYDEEDKKKKNKNK